MPSTEQQRANTDMHMHRYKLLLSLKDQSLFKTQETSILFYHWNYYFTSGRDLISDNSSKLNWVSNKKSMLCFS